MFGLTVRNQVPSVGIDLPTQNFAPPPTDAAAHIFSISIDPLAIGQAIANAINLNQERGAFTDNLVEEEANSAILK